GGEMAGVRRERTSRANRRGAAKTLLYSTGRAGGVSPRSPRSSPMGDLVCFSSDSPNSISPTRNLYLAFSLAQAFRPGDSSPPKNLALGPRPLREGFSP